MGNLEAVLPFFHYELLANERLREEFVRLHPQLASGLGAIGSSAEQDPHIKRLLQAIALMNAHTAMRIENSQARFAEALLHINYPHYLRPFPSATIVQFDVERGQGARVVDSVATVARGTDLLSPVTAGVRYKFRTVYPVTIAPIKLTQARFESALKHPPSVRVPPEVDHFISIGFESASATVGLGELGLSALPLFVDAEASMAASVIDTLFMRIGKTWLEADGDGNWTALKEAPFRQLGFADDEALIPSPARSHKAYRLLAEHGCFAEKFNFVSIDLAAFMSLLPAGARRITLHLGVTDTHHDSDLAQMLCTLTPNHFRLFCTPAVNLFPKAACAIDLDHTKTEYVLPSDAVHPRAFDIYSIDSVTAVKDTPAGSETVEYYPYYSLKHGVAGGRRGRYWHAHRNELLADMSPGMEHAISFVDLDFNPLAVEVASVSVNLTCTNRDLPSRLPIGAPQGDLTMAQPLGGIPIRMLRKPGRSYRFPAKDLWRLVSHLSLNHHSIVQDDVGPFAELLMLYNLTQSPAYQRQIDGIVGLSSRPARIRSKDPCANAFIQGMEVHLTVDEQAYAGCGLHNFVQVLDHFFGLYVHINSYVQLIIFCHRTGKEIMRCKPRSGSGHLL